MASAQGAKPRRQAPQNENASSGGIISAIKASGFFKDFFLRGNLDATFLLLLLLLLSVGTVMMFSASYTYAYYNKGGDSYHFFKKQIIFATIGIIAMLIVSRINYRKFAGWAAPAIFFIAVILLVAVLFVGGSGDEEVAAGEGADFKRWMTIAGINFQPSEVAKFALVLFLAYNMSRQHKLLQSKKKVCIRAIFDSSFDGEGKGLASANFYLMCWYAVVILSVAALIWKENHLSCTMLVLMMGVSMMWLGGVRKGWIFAAFIVVIIGAIFVVNNPDILPGYAEDRILAWTDKSFEPTGARWQTNQGLNAIASGGPFGLGFGNSRQKNLFVSEPQNDFVFSIVCEELGFVGAVAIIVLFAALICRGFVIASRSKDVFGALLTMGFVSQVGIQTVFNILVVTDTIPNTGISLPFFSYGGSSLCVLMVEMGFVLSVSRHTYKY